MRAARRDRRAALLLLAPALTMLALLTAYPAVSVFWLSLQQRVPIFGVARFAGLAHFGFLLADPRFWNAVGVTVAFTAVSVALEAGLGLGVALALHGQRRARPLSVGLLLLAWALPATVTAKLFEWLYHPTAGLVNFLLGSRTINWLGDPGLALPGLILADVWRTMPFIALLCFARLGTIPHAVREAAEVDGAGRLALFARITFPLVRPVLVIALLFRSLDALRAFDLMFVLTGGGPAGTTETLTVYAYRTLFQTLHLGVGAAIGVAVFVLVMLTAGAYLYVLAREERAR